MSKKIPYITKEKAEQIAKKFPTPFYLYDEAGIRERARLVNKAFGWNKKESTGVVKVLRILVIFTVVTLAWVVFRSPSIGDTAGFMSRYFTTAGRFIADSAGSQLVYCFMALLPLMLYELLVEFKPALYSSLIKHTVIRWAAYLILFTMIILVGVHDGSSFIYVSF